MFLFLMIKITTANLCLFVVTDSEPGLCQETFFQIVRRTGSAHFCRYPAGVKRIRIHIRPFARYCESQYHIMQLGIGVGLRNPDRFWRTAQYLKGWIPSHMRARTEVDQSLRFSDQTG